jgi:hypothetical protein
VGVAQVAFRKLSAPDSQTVEILVDGTPLVDLVRKAESESAAEEGHPNLAGKYAGLPWETLATNLLLGEATGVWSVLEGNQSPGRAPLLLCECGEPGCWPLIASIDVTPDRVTWRNFRQPYRPKWDHSNLGPFSFDRAQYLAALEEARRA